MGVYPCIPRLQFDMRSRTGIDMIVVVLLRAPP